MRFLKRRWFWITVGFMALVSLSVILTPYGLDYSIKRYFLANGADYANVGDVDFNPFTRRLAIYNLAVSVDKQNVLKIPEASFFVSGSPLFKRHFYLKRAAFKDIELTIAEPIPGRWQIGGILLPAPEEKSGPFSWGFGLHELNFTNSRIRLRSSRLSSDIIIEKAKIARLASWMPDQTAQIDFSGKINGSHLQFQGDFAAFGKGPKFSGKVKVDNLNLAPFKRAAAPYLTQLDGRLDADLNLEAHRMASGLRINQKGRLTLRQIGIQTEKLDFSDEQFSWDGTFQVEIPQAPGELKIEADGRIGGTLMSMVMGNENLRLQHQGLNWNGKLALTRKPETSGLNIDGALKLKNFKMAGSGANLAEENLTWDGGVQIETPASPDVLHIAAAGQLEGQRGSVNPTPENLHLQHGGLNWNGRFAFATQPETSDTRLEGELKLGRLEVTNSDLNLAEENLSWNGNLRIFLPENGEAQRLTTNGKLESKHQKIAFLKKNLNLANENLLWEGRFSCGLKDFKAGLDAEGDFSVTDLAITATHAKLRLLASRALNLKSIKADADSQFSVASAKITGLDLIGETGSSENASLFSASDVTVDTLRLERLKAVSIESARIIAANGVLHRKSDGRWLYINDLTTFLADSGWSSNSQRKPSQPGVTGETRPPAEEADIQSEIRIGSLEIVGDSRLHFADETVSPTFSTNVVLKEARLTGINSFQPEQASPFTLEASSRQYTRLKLQGNVQPFRERFSMDLKGKVKAVELPPLSPYAVRMLGYNLISGQMDADTELKIIMGKMEGQADLKFYDPKIEAVDPEKFKNEAGKVIPLQSALEVLRDKDNDVRLKIPISGDVTDPKFSFSDAINQALFKGLSMATLSYLKYMLGPYGMAIGIIELGVKFGAKALPGIRLEPLEFQPGVSDPDAAAREYVDKVAAILEEKKDLRLRLCGWATESDRIGPHQPTAETPAAPPAATPLADKPATGGQDVAPGDAGSPLSEEEMLALAERRADQIEEILVSRHGISDKRIFICKPQIDENPEARPRVELVF